MLVFKKGYVSPLINMVEIIKREHDENNKYTEKLIADRKERGIPLSDGVDIDDDKEDSEIKISEWEEEYYSQFKDVMISCKSVSAVELMQVKSAISKAFKADGASSNKEKNKAVIEFLKLSLVEVAGIQDAETGNDILMNQQNPINFDILDDAGLLFNIYQAVRNWQELSASKKKELE